MLTDGENNAGNISPEQAARFAQTLGVKIYTILAGDNDTSGRRRRAAPGRHSGSPSTRSCSRRSRR